VTAILRHARRDAADYALIAVVGDLDEASAPQVREAVKTFRENERHPLAIDLTAAKVHGRHGMSPLVNAYFVCRMLHTELLLVAPPPMVSRVLGGINGAPLRTFATTDELERSLVAEGASL
jgi:anti-anti-sigma factor